MNLCLFAIISIKDGWENQVETQTHDFTHVPVIIIA